jgi:hypothetical protein
MQNTQSLPPDQNRNRQTATMQPCTAVTIVPNPCLQSTNPGPCRQGSIVRGVIPTPLKPAVQDLFSKPHKPFLKGSANQ